MASTSLDGLDRAYIALEVTWTMILLGGMFFLYRHRNLPCVRIRRLPILFTGVLSLHAYGVIAVMANVIMAVFPCGVEFWVMSIYLPFGFAMFQVANTQFLHVASRQKQYAHTASLSDQGHLRQERTGSKSKSGWRRILRGTDGADRIDQMIVYVGIALVVQVLLVLLVYFGSKKFHPGYGLWNWSVEGTTEEVRLSCARGWEWWLSIIWQFFWAWIYAPYQLWQTRGVHDVHGWRLQTICCCLAGLPASPLWLAALYAPGMTRVNAFLVPPTWFWLSIVTMEVITIGFPIVQVFKSHKLHQETLDAIASWEKRQQAQHGSDSSTANTMFTSKTGTYSGTTAKSEATTASKSSFDSQKSDMFTMAALENALRTNPMPLLQFAALKDFSGENVSFLTHLAEWRRDWLGPKVSTAEHRRRQFVAAVRIYAHFVSLEFSEFPINIPSREMKNLFLIFEGSAALLVRNRPNASLSDSITPFDIVHDDADSTAGSTVELRSGVKLDALGRANLESVSHMVELVQEDALATVPIPDAFTETVFDHAEKEIKYLILTNTWPKFVNAGFEQRSQTEEKEQHIGWVKRTVLCTA